MENAQTKKTPLDLAIGWIINSGIQSGAGGFYAWYDLQDKSYSYLYSEITGYGITTLLFLYRLSKDEIFIKKAESAADWIIEFAMHPCGGVRTKLYKDDKDADRLYSFSGGKIFSFDTGMVLYGMVNLYGQTKNSRYLKAAEKLANFLIEKMQNKDGSFSAIYDSGNARIMDSLDKWSNQPGAFHTKISLGLVDLFEITRNDKYRDAAIGVCEYALSTQEKSGRFVTDKQSRTTHIHPHCYAAEGLLYAGASFNRPEFVESAETAVKWVFENLSSNGVNELYNSATERFGDFQRSDILAQALRLGIIFSLNHKLHTLQSVLLEHQYLGKETAQKGGILFSRTEEDINSWCTMFAIQALTLTKDKDLITEDKKLRLFV